MSKQLVCIFDAHLDLVMNAIEWNRDLMRPVCEIREKENGMTDKPDRGKSTVSLPELRDDNIGLVVATQIARFSKEFTGSLGSNWSSPEIAWSITQAQLAWYSTMEEYLTTGYMVISYELTANKGLFPIPFNEISLNPKLIQNDGY